MRSKAPKPDWHSGLAIYSFSPGVSGCLLAFCVLLVLYLAATPLLFIQWRRMRETIARYDSIENSQRVTNAEWRRICSSTADVTFDPETAHPLLIVSKDGKEVRLGDTQQRVTDNPKRFDYCINVLARKGIHLRETLLGSGGRGEDGLEFRSHQRVSRSRKGGIILNPYFGYWTVWLKNENKYTANIDHPVLLPLRVKPWTVGVFLDYDEGQVSFYNAQSRSHLYTFTDTLYPFFNPELNHGGKNAAPVHTLTPQHTDHSELIICQYLCLVRAAQSQWRLSLTFSPPNSKPP